MDVLEQVMTDPKIEVEPITFYDLMFVLNHRDKVNRYDDVIILSTSRRLDVPLLTFDMELKALERKV
ncbi:MAG: hypothetical protein RMK31_00235 [Candidatus Caldarchaeum sp.]|nr:hypothetical protein [Candidatus Caldarchaeum sp.]